MHGAIVFGPDAVGTEAFSLGDGRVQVSTSQLRHKGIYPHSPDGVHRYGLDPASFEYLGSLFGW